MRRRRRRMRRMTQSTLLLEIHEEYQLHKTGRKPLQDSTAVAPLLSTVPHARNDRDGIPIPLAALTAWHRAAGRLSSRGGARRRKALRARGCPSRRIRSRTAPCPRSGCTRPRLLLPRTRHAARTRHSRPQQALFPKEVVHPNLFSSFKLERVGVLIQREKSCYEKKSKKERKKLI